MRGLWLSRIRIDYGVENVLAHNAMIEKPWEGQDDFISGPTTKNQCFEKMWRDIICCVVHVFYYISYALRDKQLFTIDSAIDVLALCLLFLPRINQALNERVIQ